MPVPVSPSSNTEASEGATCSTFSSIATKAGELPTSPCAARLLALANDTHGFDEIDDLPLIVVNRPRFDIDMLFATRRMV